MIWARHIWFVWDLQSLDNPQAGRLCIKAISRQLQCSSGCSLLGSLKCVSLTHNDIWFLLNGTKQRRFNFTDCEFLIMIRCRAECPWWETTKSKGLFPALAPCGHHSVRQCMKYKLNIWFCSVLTLNHACHAEVNWRGLRDNAIVILIHSSAQHDTTVVSNGVCFKGEISGLCHITETVQPQREQKEA